MALTLVELNVAAPDREALQPVFDQVAGEAAALGADLIELQVAQDLNRVYAVLEHDQPAAVRGALEARGLEVVDATPVRLVGASLDELKALRGKAQAGYLVEWDFPPDLTMDTYLQRKAAKAPLYAQVPEVKFLRTYVREDMVKCLCFYDAPDEAAVRKARDVVSTPVDRLSRLG